MSRESQPFSFHDCSSWCFQFTADPPEAGDLPLKTDYYCGHRQQPQPALLRKDSNGGGYIVESYRILKDDPPTPITPLTVVESPVSQPPHFAYIDALRGLAFLCVLATHCTMPVGQFPGRYFFVQGSYGVELFFLISAITLCNSMDARKKVERFPVLSFYLRRLFRIAPLFWLALLFYSVFPNVIPVVWQRYWAPDGIENYYYPLTFFFLHGWHPMTLDSIVPGGWSIAVEMTFYAVFPFLFKWLNGLRRATVGVLLGIALSWALFLFAYPALKDAVFPDAPLTLWNAFQNLSFPTQFPVFLIGISLYWLLKKPILRDVLATRFWSNALALTFLALIISFIVMPSSGLVPVYLLAVLAIAGFVAAVSSGRQKLLVNSAVRYLGTISFSCYLVHFIAFGLVLRLFGIEVTDTHRIVETGSPAGNALLFAKLFAATLVLTVILASVTYYTVELFGISLGKKLISRMNSTS